MVFSLAIGFTTSAQSNGTYGGMQKDYGSNDAGTSSGGSMKFRKTRRAKRSNSNTSPRRRNRYKYKMIRKERRKPFYGRDNAGRRSNSFYYKR